MRYVLPLLLGAAVLAGCDNSFLGDDGTGPSVSAAYVVSQGNFSDGNGSVVTYVPATRQVRTPLTGLATTLQSAFVDGEDLYLAADKAGRVDVFATASMGRNGSPITGLPSARYMAKAADKLYVTSVADVNGGFTAGAVSVVDLARRTVTAKIALPAAAEGIVLSGGRLYVALHGFGSGRNIAVVSPTSNTVTQTLEGVCDGPRSLFLDREGDVNVLCTGTTTYDNNFNVTGRTNGSIVVLDGITGAVKVRVPLTAQAGAENSGQDGFLDRAGDLLYFVQGKSVRRFNTRTNVLAGTAVTTLAPIGAVAYDAERSELLVGLYPRSSPFTVAGELAVYNATNLDAAPALFTAGIAPTFIALR